MNKNLKTDTEGLLRAVSVVGDLMEPRMSWLQGVAFLQIAVADLRGEELDVQTLQKRMGVASSTATRLVQGLGEYDRMQKPGMKVVREVMDLRDRRRRYLSLSPKGRRVIEAAIKELKR